MYTSNAIPGLKEQHMADEKNTEALLAAISKLAEQTQAGFARVDGRFDRLQADVRDINQRLMAVESIVNQHSVTLAEHTSFLRSLARAADTDPLLREIAALKERVAKLEAQLARGN